ncbi:MAG: hypothetical protein AAGA03_09965 [Planctomycetota bacterium]
MRYDDALVGSLAIGLALVSIAVCLGPWTGPYQLRSIAAVKRRFGMSAARSIWFLIAVAAMMAGVSILTGIRPTYATPSPNLQTAR